MVWKSALVAIATSLALGSTGYCFYQQGARQIAENHDKDERLFINRLRNPNAGYSCCDEADCHATEEDIRDGHYWARIGRVVNGEWDLLDWVKIPDEVVLKKENLPKEGKHPGHPVICEKSNKGTEPDKPLSNLTIYCYLPGVGI